MCTIFIEFNVVGYINSNPTSGSRINVNKGLSFERDSARKKIVQGEILKIARSIIRNTVNMFMVRNVRSYRFIHLIIQTIIITNFEVAARLISMKSNRLVSVIKKVVIEL